MAYSVIPLVLLALNHLGTGAVFKLVAQRCASDVGAVTGVVGAAGDLGGSPP